jgi:hypothetical protein
LVSYQKDTGDDQTFVNLLKQAQAFATGTVICDRLTKNVGIGLGNLSAQELKPFFESINRITDSPTHPANKLQQLREQIMPKLPALATRLGTINESYNAVLDAVAMALRSISIEAHNDHQDFATAESALQIASKLVAGQDLRRRIAEDVKVLASNKADSLCFFCGVNPCRKDSVFELAMYGNVQRGFNSVNYSKGSVPIARCEVCKGKHGKTDGIGCAVWIGCIVVGILIGSTQSHSASGDALIGGAFLGFLAGALVSWITKSMMQLDQTMKKPGDHPQVQKMIREGWSIGSSPGRYG